MQATPTSLIVCGDGGLQGSFIAGAMSQVVHHWPIQSSQIPHIFATSASIASLFYYLSHGGHHGGEKLWTNDVPNSEFLSYTSLRSLFSGKPVYDIDHLVDIVMHRNYPLNLDNVRATPIHFLFPILNLQTRNVELFSNKPEQALQFFPNHTIHNWLDYDVYELIKAACAIPILYDRPVLLNGIPYCDAGIITPFLVPTFAPAGTRALYLVVRQKTIWSHDWKLILAALIWRARAAFGKTGLPGWVYTAVALKPFRLTRLTQRLHKLIPNLTLISASTSLQSSLRNTPETALHNWQTGTAHINTRHADIQSTFWKI